jgi:hypothetical protein
MLFRSSTIQLATRNLRQNLELTGVKNADSIKQRETVQSTTSFFQKSMAIYLNSSSWNKEKLFSTLINSGGALKLKVDFNDAFYRVIDL